MNPNTGEIKDLSMFAADEPKIEIPEEALPAVKKMNRKARRAWAVKQTKLKKQTAHVAAAIKSKNYVVVE